MRRYINCWYFAVACGRCKIWCINL